MSLKASQKGHHRTKTNVIKTSNDITENNITDFINIVQDFQFNNKDKINLALSSILDREENIQKVMNENHILREKLKNLEEFIAKKTEDKAELNLSKFKFKSDKTKKIFVSYLNRYMDSLVQYLLDQREEEACDVLKQKLTELKNITGKCTLLEEGNNQKAERSSKRSRNGSSVAFSQNRSNLLSLKRDDLKNKKASKTCEHIRDEVSKNRSVKGKAKFEAKALIDDVNNHQLNIFKLQKNKNLIQSCLPDKTEQSLITNNHTKHFQNDTTNEFMKSLKANLELKDLNTSSVIAESKIIKTKESLDPIKPITEGKEVSESIGNKEKPKKLEMSDYKGFIQKSNQIKETKTETIQPTTKQKEETDKADPLSLLKKKKLFLSDRSQTLDHYKKTNKDKEHTKKTRDTKIDVTASHIIGLFKSNITKDKRSSSLFEQKKLKNAKIKETEGHMRMTEDKRIDIGKAILYKNPKAEFFMSKTFKNNKLKGQVALKSKGKTLKQSDTVKNLRKNSLKNSQQSKIEHNRTNNPSIAKDHGNSLEIPINEVRKALFESKCEDDRDDIGIERRTFHTFKPSSVNQSTRKSELMSKQKVIKSREDIELNKKLFDNKKDRMWSRGKIPKPKTNSRRSTNYRKKVVTGGEKDVRKLTRAMKFSKPYEATFVGGFRKYFKD